MIRVPDELYNGGHYVATQYPSRVSDAEKQRKHISARITFLLDNEVFTDSDIQADGITITSQVNDGNVCKFGCAYGTEATITLFASDKTNTTNLYSAFTIEFGIDIENYGMLWVNKGTFIPDTIVKDEVTGIISIHAFDKMKMFDVSAKSVLQSITFPCKIVDILREVCNYVGINFSYPVAFDIDLNNEIDFSNYPIDSCRDVIELMAELVGQNAYITSIGLLSFRGSKYVQSIYTLDDLYNFTYTNRANSYNKTTWQYVLDNGWHWSDMTVYQYGTFSLSPYEYDGVNIYTKDGRELIFRWNNTGTPYIITNNPFFDSFSNADVQEFVDDLQASGLESFGHIITLTSDVGILYEINDAMNLTGIQPAQLSIYSMTLTWNGSLTLTLESSQDYVKDERNEA